jgi:hypothetical protein
MTYNDKIEMEKLKKAGEEVVVSWTLYADNMVPKEGTEPILTLQDF